MPPAPPEAQKKPPPQKDAAKDAAKGAAKAPDKPGTKDAAGKDQQATQAGARPGAAKPDAANQAGKDAAEAGQRLDRMAVRAKMAVSAPGDPVEREADQVADKVMRSMAGAGRGVAPRHDPPAISREGADRNDPSRPTVPSDFAKDLGTGTPLDAATRAAFERQFGRDFSRVRIHDDAKADAASRRIGARAFTIGDNIAFAGGEYEPETPEGRRLLAHELTHVVQQSGGVTRMVMRNPAGGAAPKGGGAATPGASEFAVTGSLQIPPIKGRHSPSYAARALKKVLRRPRAYNAATRGTDQVGEWKKGVKIDLSKIPALHKPASGPWSLPLQQEGGSAFVGGKPLTGTEAEIKEKLQRPDWDIYGAPQDFQVDHMVEFQLGGEDAVSNFELLNQTHNGSVGSSFSHEINNAIRQELAAKPASLPALPGVAMPAQPTPDFVKTNYDIVFQAVEGRGRQSRRNEGDSSFWSIKQIEAAEPATKLLPKSNTPLDGKADRLSLLSPTGLMVVARLPVSGDGIKVPKDGLGGIAGFNITGASLSVGIAQLGGTAGVAADTPVGQLEGDLDLGPAVTFPKGPRHSLAIQKAKNPYAVKIASKPTPGPNGTENLIPATFEPLSPMEITGLTVGNGVFAGAAITPDHPALAGLRIPGRIHNGKVGIFHTVDVTSLAERMKIPGLTVDGASVTIGYDGVAVSVGGSLAFTIRNFGQGVLTAELDSRKFSLEGSFRPDPRLFDEASMKLWYRSDEGFGGAGHLAITNPKKIKGVRSAKVAAKYEKGVFHADGTVEPDLPGVQNAGLSVTYGPDASGADSLLVAGELQLGAGIPGLSSGSIKVTLVQKDDAWKVSAAGTIKPDLPGMSPQINLAYNDGLFDGTVSASFSRSIFSGDVEVGLTNRAVTPEGTLSGTEPGPDLRLYGKGDVTAKIAPQLAGKVGIKLKPTGSLLISGRVGIAEAVTIFEQYPKPPADRREIFSTPPFVVPLLGAPGAGIDLSVSAGAEGYASVGPGKLTQAEIGVLDFDPAQPDSLHITGKARFELPAAAGVDAKLNAAVSAGVGLKLKADLDVKAGVGVDAKASPQVDVDWTPTTGLHLHAQLDTTLTPKLKFGVVGSVGIVVGAWGHYWNLWRKSWTLLEKEVGTNLSIGVTAPVDYYSRDNSIVFDPKKVTFNPPPLNAETLKSLLNGGGDHSSKEGEGEPPDP
ncbi:eCIS core domain-containing protein [Falsiroseomonas sp. HW251]|uniref:eCIS core domain-containing protein n=1 Tax=Falsiroseomonas sp. HW251 TaxID=3390998 RepID=UPI003D3110EF